MQRFLGWQRWRSAATHWLRNYQTRDFHPPQRRIYFQDRNRGSYGSWNAHRKRQYAVAGIVVSGGAIYYASHLDQAPLTHRRRMIDISPQQEAAIGLANFRQILEQYHGKVLPATSATSRYVERIGRRIAQSAESLSEPGIEYDWKFVVIDSPEPNAFCLPGGKVAVFTGILPILIDEDSVAAVLSHEIAHAVARHGAEKLAFTKVLLLVQIIVNQFIDTRFVTHMLTQLLLSLPFSRRMESEADFIGLHLMAAACFNPEAMGPMFQRMATWRDQATRGRKAPPSYLSTHPADEERVVAIMSWLPKVMPEYESKCGTATKEWRRFRDLW